MKGRISLFSGKHDVAIGDANYSQRQARNLNLENILLIDQMLIQTECLML